jgi:hypothetical protein
MHLAYKSKTRVALSATRVPAELVPELTVYLTSITPGLAPCAPPEILLRPSLV